MKNARLRDPLSSESAQPFPSHAAALASAPERVLPCSKDLGSEAVETMHVRGHGVIREVSADHR
jgi:hypothetical protein